MAAAIGNVVAITPVPATAVVGVLEVAVTAAAAVAAAEEY